MKTIAGLFRTVEEAERAIDALEEAGFERSSFGVLTQRNVVTKEELDEEDTILHSGHRGHDVSGAEGAGIGAAEGAVVGGLTGLLMAAGALLIPGLGPVISLGTLAATLGSAAAGAGVGAVAGAVTGGVVASLVHMGIPEEEAHFYAEGVKRGGVLVTVHADESKAGEAEGIMQRARALEVNAYRETWRDEGWERFDPVVPVAVAYPRLHQ